MALELEIVDVFAEAPLEGNPLAVVRGAGDLSPGRMQAIAREMNLSETTFVTDESDPARPRVRIFTPARELPFAGHPTLGTAWVLTRGERPITLGLGVGPVDVDFVDGVAWMQPPAPELGETLSAAAVSERLGLSADAIHPDFAPQLGSVGIGFLLVGLATIAELEAFTLRADQFAALPAEHLFLFAPGEPTRGAEGPENRYRARMFFEAGGLREDPATGSANTVFAAYLRRAHGERFVAEVTQGVEIGRPSHLTLDVSPDRIRIGGRTQPVARGTFCVSD